MRLLISILLFSLLARSQNTPRFEMMVYLKAQPDFRGLQMVVDRPAKMKMMYSSLVKITQQTQNPLWRILKQRGYSYQSFYINNSLLIRNADAALATELQKNPSVKKVSYNTSFRTKLVNARNSIRGHETTKIEPGLAMINADKVWALNISGQGIVVGGLDSGVQWDHPALIRQYRGNDGRSVNHDFSWHDAILKQTNKTMASKCGYNLKAPCDDTGHGTHTLGTVLGNDGVTSVIGVAPSARWMACRNMDNGIGTVATYTDCFEFFFAPYKYGSDPQKDGRPEFSPHILNNSWGCDKIEGCQGDEFSDILKVYHQAGTMMVVSAGNSGLCGTISSPPANDSAHTLSVGSVDRRKSASVFSSRGPSTLDGGIGPDLVAPGEFIRSASHGGGYREQSGTSMATPHVAGAIALLWSANKSLIGRVDETTAILIRSAAPLKSDETCGGVLGTQVPNNTFGYGLLDVFAAVNLSHHFRSR